MMNDSTPYKLWYRCLNLSNRKQWSKKVRQWFGPADGLEWEQWWEHCRGHFIDDTPPFLMKELVTKEDLAWWYDEWREPELNDSFVVMVSLTNSKEALLAEFERLLRARHTSKPGRPKQEGGSLAEFDLAGPVNIQGVSKALDVYERRDTKPLWQLGVDCKVNLHQIPRSNPNLPPDDPKQPTPSSDQRRILTVTVSRYLKRAAELIEGVEQGVFPAPPQKRN